MHQPINVINHHQTDNKLYLVLDYCPGGELFFHLSRYKRFPEGVVRFYAAELVLALKVCCDAMQQQQQQQQRRFRGTRELLLSFSLLLFLFPSSVALCRAWFCCRWVRLMLLPFVALDVVALVVGIAAAAAAAAVLLQVDVAVTDDFCFVVFPGYPRACKGCSKKKLDTPLFFFFFFLFFRSKGGGGGVTKIKYKKLGEKIRVFLTHF